MVMNYSTMLFSFKGRLNRAPYWLALLATGMVGMGIVLPIAVFIGNGTRAMLALVVLIVAALIWISLAVAIKRLHDRDKSGWWLLLFYFAPSILQAVGHINDAATIILGVIAIGISIWAFVEIGCLRGTAGANSYGPDPLQLREVA